MFYKHILHQHVDQHNQSRNPSASQHERSEEVVWSESCALWPKRYSAMNLWVTLALIFVYLTVHFKIDSDGCLSLDIYLSWCVLSPFCLPPVHSLFFSCSFPLTKTLHPGSASFAVRLLASSRFLQPDYAIDTGKPLMQAL